VVTAAALETLRVLEEEDLVNRCRQTGAYFNERLQALKARHRVVEAVRGLGLMLGLVLKQPAGPVVESCLQRGFLVNAVQERILRFVPPLVISEEQIDGLIRCLDEVLKEKFATAG
jgi:acetylornithine/succinyldiaminopimelate/putrescine aminotransferase